MDGWLDGWMVGWMDGWMECKGGRIDRWLDVKAGLWIAYTKSKCLKNLIFVEIFRIEFLVAPCVLLSLILNHEFSVMEILWTFSIYLEALAILPQLFLVQKTGEAETITSHYLFALGIYRFLYILNWVYRYYVEGSTIFTCWELARLKLCYLSFCERCNNLVFFIFIVIRYLCMTSNR